MNSYKEAIILGLCIGVGLWGGYHSLNIDNLFLAVSCFLVAGIAACLWGIKVFYDAIS